MVVLFVLGFVLFMVIIWDTIGMSVVGFPKSDKEILKVLESLKNNEPEIYCDEVLKDKISPLYKSEIISDTLISTFGKPYMSKALNCGSFKWYIGGYGAVPRWYKSHSEIEKLYNELKKKNKL